MPVRIRIPTVLRKYADGHSATEVDAASVDEALAALAERFPALRPHLFDGDGRLRNFVNVYLGDENVRHLDAGARTLAAGAELSIVPAVAGGSGGSPGRGGNGLPDFSPEELQRYSRHLIIPEVGLAGQRKLKAASVLLVGTGGLGSPLALYLAAAGVGRLGIVDFDTVDYTNLQRQIIHTTADVGRSKLASAREKIAAINPFVRVELHETRLSSENALGILAGYDVVVDGTDNFPTRYLVNDACVLLGKPNVYGSIYRFEGQASVFDAARGPCYRCLYPEPPPPGLVPSCAEGGVLGILPGIIGTLQANETVKLILGIGDSLAGRLLLFDALAMEFRQVRLRKDPACPVCGDHPTVTGLIDYEEFCGIGGQPAAASEVPEMSAAELAARRGEVDLIDVREPFEAEIARIDGARLIPLGELPARLDELDRGREIVVHCRSGIRSARAVRTLLDAGFPRVWNLRGGILAWAEEIEPDLARY